jgi:hypothetical protein
VLHFKGGFSHKKQQHKGYGKAGCRGSRRAGGADQQQDAGHENNLSKKTGSYEHFDVFIVKIIAQVTLTHAGVQVFLIEEFLTVTGADAEKPGLVFMKDLKGIPPHAHSQR